MFAFGVEFLPTIVMLLSMQFIVDGALSEVMADPKFSGPIQNATVAVGRDAVLTCMVEDLGAYKTILTIRNNVITKNHRISILHSEHRTWHLKIKDIRESDRGFYMCQINTDPMKSQTGYLDVVAPPDILDFPTSTDMVVNENSNITLICEAKGSPQPNITWKREGPTANHPAEKIYSNGFLKDAIKKRSICTKNIRFSHDRSSNNGPNDGKSKTSDPVNCANETAKGEKFPDPPTTCCMSGCANCVWIQYAEEISSKLKNGSDVAREIIMKEVQDTNMRSFLEMELRMLKIREKK